MESNRGRNTPELFVVSAPSGAGKSTLTRAVVAGHPTLKLSISCTTRPPRGDEKHGVDYYFLSQTDFSDRREDGEFLEYAQVHGNYYGTSRKHVEEFLKDGFNVLFDIDIQGAEQVKRAYPEARRIFILPPSRKELARRLKERKTDDPAEIEKRLRNAIGEMAAARRYDYLIVNDDIPRAQAELLAIIDGHPPDQTERKAVLARLLEEFEHGSPGD